MAEPEKNEHSEEQFDDLSLEELLRGAREEIARVDAMMGNPADEPVQEPDAADALDAAAKARRTWRRTGMHRHGRSRRRRCRPSSRSCRTSMPT